MKRIAIAVSIALSLAGCNKPQPAADTAPAPSQAQSAAPSAPTTRVIYGTVPNQLDGPGGPQFAQTGIQGLQIQCNALTGWGLAKTYPTGIKAFKAQCDGKDWYVLFEDPSGIVKFMQWTGSGEPH